MKLTLYLLAESPGARRFEVPGPVPRRQLWIPRSVCDKTLKFPEFGGKVRCEVDVADWFAKKAGLA